MGPTSPITYARAGICLLLLLYVDAASAASLELLEEMQLSFKTETEKWFEPLETIAQRLLLGLAIVSLAWNFVQVILRSGDFQDIFLVLVKHLMTIGLFLAIIFNAKEWTAAILDGFIAAAGSASGQENPDMSAASVLHQGTALGQKITQLGSAWWEPIILYPLALIAVLLYAVMAAYMLLVYAETYIVTAGGIILLGFAGTDWTLDYAKRYLTYCISVGAKLYVLYLVVGLGSQMINTWADEQALSDRSVVIAVIGVLFVLVVLVVMLPNLIQSVINGSSLAGPGLASSGVAATGSLLVASAGGGSHQGAPQPAPARGAGNSFSPGFGSGFRTSPHSSPSTSHREPSSAHSNPGGGSSTSHGLKTPRLSLASGRRQAARVETLGPLRLGRFPGRDDRG